MRLAVIALPVLVAAVAVVAVRSQRQWTSDSADAVAELAHGMQAEMKLYKAEAAAHYEKALAADPGLVAAKLMLAISGQVRDKQRLKELLSDVRTADLSRLSAGERFLVRYHVAKLDMRSDEAERAVDAHLTEYPEDAYALFLHCTDLWDKPDWDAAERCNRELLRIAPNWVLAYNYLGYIAMAQGRFDEAEKSFLAYKYIAPDQANPRDSLGELYTLRGRYEDAASELDEALRLRPDFCLSYRHLLLVAALRGDAAAADAVVARAAAAGHCGDAAVASLRCSATLWQRTLERDWRGAWAAASGECLDRLGNDAVLAHRAATLCGELAAAAELERRPRKSYPAGDAAPEKRPRSAGAAHMEGSRLLAQGDATGAIACFDEADRGLVFAGEGQGVLKLLNQLALADALRAAGLAERAATIEASVVAVNPRLPALFS